ncbi:class I SAM-dependent methyltransferase [Brachybacterium sp.]|uniref:class I SAM-dependent methyltransferase n=1 Tax=Brachybacterium sp. TaxID=1891286 RepID=UPI002ED616B9
MNSRNSRNRRNSRSDPLHPPVPPISSRAEPRFASAARKDALAGAFQDQGEDYDRLRPGYPVAALDAMLAQVTASGSSSGSSSGSASDSSADRPLRAVDLGAGTGKLSWALVDRGLEVIAVDTSAAMLETALRRGNGPGPSTDPVTDPTPEPAADPTPEPAADPTRPPAAHRSTRLSTHLAVAEATGLPEGCADLITVAQAWHWFDAVEASAEVVRLLAPGGVLALVWNMLDVTIPWVHRLSRIMHAGDIHREDFLPTVGARLELVERSVHRWEDPMPTGDVIDLARTRSYVITAPEERRAKVLANLDWYLHDHLGHAPGALVGVPYRTDLFLYRVAGRPVAST